MPKYARTKRYRGRGTPPSKIPRRTTSGSRKKQSPSKVVSRAISRSGRSKIPRKSSSKSPGKSSSKSPGKSPGKPMRPMPPTRNRTGTASRGRNNYKSKTRATTPVASSRLARLATPKKRNSPPTAKTPIPNKPKLSNNMGGYTPMGVGGPSLGRKQQRAVSSERKKRISRRSSTPGFLSGTKNYGNG